MDEERDTALGQRIRSLRNKLGVSTREFSRGIPGLQSSNLSEIERGVRRPTVPMIVAICKKYHIGIEEIIDLPKRRGGDGIKVNWVPIYKATAAGRFLRGVMAENEEPIGYMPTTTNDSRAVHVLMATDCIKDFGVCKGDSLLIEPGREVESGNIVLAATMDGHSIIRKYYKQESGEVMLLGSSEEAPVVINRQEMPKYKFYRATAVIKTL